MGEQEGDTLASGALCVRPSSDPAIHSWPEPQHVSQTRVWTLTSGWLTSETAANKSVAFHFNYNTCVSVCLWYTGTHAARGPDARTHRVCSLLTCPPPSCLLVSPAPEPSPGLKVHLPAPHQPLITNTLRKCGCPDFKMSGNKKRIKSVRFVLCLCSGFSWFLNKSLHS